MVLFGWQLRALVAVRPQHTHTHTHMHLRTTYTLYLPDAVAFTHHKRAAHLLVYLHLVFFLAQVSQIGPLTLHAHVRSSASHENIRTLLQKSPILIGFVRKRDLIFCGAYNNALAAPGSDALDSILRRCCPKADSTDGEWNSRISHCRRVHLLGLNYRDMQE